MTKEVTSAEIAAIAARGLANPAALTLDEIKSVCASALTQREAAAPRSAAVDK